MEKRFYCAEIPDHGTVLLEGPEAHHLSKVMRLAPGESVALFDGAGLVATAEIVTIGKRDVTLAIHHSERTPPPNAPLVIAAAVPKGDRFDWMVEKLTELGVTQLIPLRTARGVVDPRDTKLERLRQVIIEACKQSRRAWKMDLAPVTDFTTLLHQPGSLLIADPSGQPFADVSPTRTASPLTIAIGPEGGWSEEELRTAHDAGVGVINLGETILRIETAAVAITAVHQLSGRC